MTQLPEVMQALMDPKSYPDITNKVELVQTQMSLIFLIGEFVYKVKKPVNLGYLDYTTLDKRHFFCLREVELNQRLCAEAYLGVVSITHSVGHHILVGGEGEVLEYAVKMRYLPREMMLDQLLVHKQVSPQMMSRVAKRVADFHRRADSNPTISSFGSLDTIIQNIEENFSQTAPNIGRTITREQYQQIRDYTNTFVEKNAPLFEKRAADGRIRDCHGDLHAAHICFMNGICIYDCIEFNDRFRYADVASEVAFLAMDLDNYGQPDLSKAFVDAYLTASKDKDLPHLLNFYKCYRAYVRGKVEGFKLDDPLILEQEKTKILTVARRYFTLATTYCGT